jgi:nucleotidyltransferase/DNA polymerase involved in DNA repair
LDAFFCAVEVLRDPTLQGKPFVVGGAPEGRGVVASCSYPARRFGIHSAQPTAHAVRLCPDLIILPPRRKAYSAQSHQVMARLGALTPLVEKLSIDEAFLDVSDLADTGLEIAKRLQAEIRQSLSLPCSLGVATNKLVAKIATDVAKASAEHDGPPNAILAVPAGSEAGFLADLPTEALWGVGPKTAAHLARLKIHTIGDIAGCDEQKLIRAFGKVGRDLWHRAHGRDDRPVVTHHETKSVSRETTFARDTRDPRRIDQTLRRLSASVADNLRRIEQAGTTIKLKLRWPDFTTLSRQATLTEPTDKEAKIYNVSRSLLDKAWGGRRPIRLIGVGVSNLGAPRRQLGLWERDWQRESTLYELIRELQDRYGEDALRRGIE